MPFSRNEVKNNYLVYLLDNSFMYSHIFSYEILYVFS